ncbi:kinase-like domain-containing protein [Rhizophagus irregularis DAOM 181602=DAOM 197198]|nr:kinase-like domain-containing protein [Rhizophagus irregularis DAOM 181602=DAOM 197198]
MELLKKIFKKKPRNTSMEILNKSFKEKPRNLWKYVDWDKYHTHATVSSIDSTTKSDDIDDRIIYMDEIEKRKEIFAKWPEGRIGYWDIEHRKWIRATNYEVALKSLDNSSEISLRPKISEGIPKLFVDLIMKCWDAKAENRPTAKELYQVLKKWDKEGGINSEIYFQMNEYEKIRKHKLESKSSENMSESKKSHPQAIYTSRLLNFKNLPEPLNSSDLSLFQLNSDDVPSVSANPISECFDCKI